MKSIILCADDYGQNTAISQAIINLFKKNRLSATSCMTNAPNWLVCAPWLAPFSGLVDLGLHFNLTEGELLVKEGMQSMPLPQLILKAYLRQLKQAAIEQELHAQLDRFVEGVGRLPDFLDGHQHIHQLPVIRDAVLRVYDQRLRQQGCYIRSVADTRSLWQVGSQDGIKSLIIQLCGAHAFKKALVQQSVPHNASFAGVYDFADASQFRNHFPEFLTKVTEKGIIMCHPGLPNSADHDEIVSSRCLEYEYLQGEQFVADCAKKQVNLSRFSTPSN